MTGSRLHSLRRAKNPLRGLARVIDVHIDEVARAIRKFDNEARDRYAVVVELALGNRSPELARATCSIVVEVGQRHDPLVGGVELKRGFWLSARTYRNDEGG